MAKNEYKRCPRCELNYILATDKLCSVCKKEVESAFHGGDDDDFDLSGDYDICPICKTNYIREDEDVCANCARERDLDRTLHGDSVLFDDLSDQDDYENDKLKDDDEFGDMISIADEDELTAGMNDLDMDIPMDDVDMDDFDDDEPADDDLDDDFDDDFDDDDDDDADDEDEEDEDK